jgi:Flp pilus assembly protein TadG
MSLLDRFIRNKRGNVAMMFALAMIPVVGAVGAAIDYTRVAQVRTKLADALDAGVLAVGSQAAMTDAQAYTMIKQWIDVHMGTANAAYWNLDSVTQNADGKIIASVSGNVETTVARVLGIDKIPIAVTSQAVRSIGKVEIALVLDNTGSMKGAKIAALKDAASSLVDSLAKATSNPNDLKIGLVPFSQTVNVGPAYQNAAWIDAAGNSASAKSLFLGQTVSRFALFQKLGKSWGGCVESRAMPYEASGAQPGGVNPDTLYVPYFAPDEPGGKGDYGYGTYNNSYLADSTLANILEALGLTKVAAGVAPFLYLQGDITKYAGAPYGGTTLAMGYQYGPNSGCEIAPLLRLSTDTASVKTAINAMIANGNTDIPIGLAWGWNLLAPQAPFNDAVPYGTADWGKFVVLMTDGNNENNQGNQEDDSYYSGVGYIWQGRMGMTAGTKAQRTVARDARLAEMCANMKAEGIVIYTVRVEVTNGSSNVLQNCASNSDKFYEVADSSNLAAAFANIGNSIQKLRLAR